MASNKPKPTITVVAELIVTSPLGAETIKSFDKAWHRALEMPRPVTVSFNGFVRKDGPIVATVVTDVPVV